MIVIKERIRVHCRWMIRRDMPEVLTTEANLPSPWEEMDFLRALRQQNVIGMVAERGEQVVGHSIYHLREDDIQLLRLAVHPRHRRNGIASQLVSELKDKVSPHYRRTRITALVPESALDVQLFLRAAWFRCEEIVGDEYGFAFRRDVP